MVESPPSTEIIWPVIHVDLSDRRKLIISEISSLFPILFRGWFSDDFWTLTSLFKNLFARGVSTIDGAITLTLIFGANSAAKDLARPSIAPLDKATLEWKGIPFETATVLRKTILALIEFDKFGKIVFNDSSTKRFSTIPGRVPDIFERSKGCYFKERCLNAQKKCSLNIPKEDNLGNGHYVSCF